MGIHLCPAVPHASVHEFKYHHRKASYFPNGTLDACILQVGCRLPYSSALHFEGPENMATDPQDKPKASLLYGVSGNVGLRCDCLSGFA